MGLGDLHASAYLPENPGGRSELPGNPHTERAAPLTRLWHFLPEHLEICAWEKGGAEHDSPAMLLGKVSSGWAADLEAC